MTYIYINVYLFGSALDPPCAISPCSSNKSSLHPRLSLCPGRHPNGGLSPCRVCVRADVVRAGGRPLNGCVASSPALLASLASLLRTLDALPPPRHHPPARPNGPRQRHSQPQDPVAVARGRGRRHSPRPPPSNHGSRAPAEDTRCCPEQTGYGSHAPDLPGARRRQRQRHPRPHLWHRRCEP